MKKFLVLLAAVLISSAAFTASAIKRIEFEPRVGVSCLSNYKQHEGHLGYNVGGMVAIPVSERFYINPGISFFSTFSSDQRVGALQVPVYASYRIPVKKTLLRLNVGPYAMLGDYDFGLSAEVGVEYKKWYGAVNAYQSMLFADETTGIFGLSFGYKFSLSK